MGSKFKRAGLWPAIAFGAVLLVALFIAAGCGDEETTTGDTKASTTSTEAVGVGKGKVYVGSGVDGIGYAIVDLETKQVEVVNLPEALEPHGVIFDPQDVSVDYDTRGRVTSDEPKFLYVGNTKDGAVLKVDTATKKVVKSIMPPAGAKLAICGMQMGPDDRIWLSSMGDGKAYPLDTKTDTIGEGIGGGDATSSICGVAWSEDGKFAYMSNMKNAADESQAGYVAKVNWPEGTLVKKIENVTQPQPGKVIAHQAEATPDGKFLYVTDSGAGALIKIDMSTDEVIKTVPIGGKEIHSIVFTPDGKTAYLAVREVPDATQSSVFVYDVEKDEVIDQIPGIPPTKVCSIILQQD